MCHVRAQEDKERAQRASQRVAAVKALRSEMGERAGAAREARAAAVRGVEKAHARLAREANKAADDMRARRMEALKVRASSARSRYTPTYSRPQRMSTRASYAGCC